MPKTSYPWKGIPLALTALLCSLALHSDSLPVEHSRLASLPRLTLWAWERREDMHAIDTRQFAVAYLDQTIMIGFTAQSHPRRNLLVLPSSATRIPVVRIEVLQGALLNEETRNEVVQDVVATSRQTGIAALQIDFDATRSQRQFYRGLLFDLRRQLPAGLPLSITALASWCSWDVWIHDLPIDEAVPMMFRMEPDHRRVGSSIDDFQIREPLCRTSVGVSTDETWPSRLDHKRIYVFADNGWRSSSTSDVAGRLQ